MRIILAKKQELGVIFTPEDAQVALEYLVYLLDMGRISEETLQRCMAHLNHGVLPDNVVPFPTGIH